MLSTPFLTTSLHLAYSILTCIFTPLPLRYLPLRLSTLILLHLYPFIDAVLPFHSFLLLVQRSPQIDFLFRNTFSPLSAPLPAPPLTTFTLHPQPITDTALTFFPSLPVTFSFNNFPHVTFSRLLFPSHLPLLLTVFPLHLYPLTEAVLTFPLRHLLPPVKYFTFVFLPRGSSSYFLLGACLSLS